MAVTGKIMPTGNGNYTDWTGDFNDVDEDPHDSDTTKIEETTGGQRDSYTHDGSGLGAETITKVTVYAVAKSSGGFLPTIGLFVRSNGTDSNDDEHNIDGNYTEYSSDFAVDPVTSANTMTIRLSLE